MAKRKDPPAEEGAPAWMATFSDLMNLLLCFFVLLFASSTMDEGKIQKIAASFDNISFPDMTFSHYIVHMLDFQTIRISICIPSRIGQRTAHAGEHIPIEITPS